MASFGTKARAFYLRVRSPSRFACLRFILRYSFRHARMSRQLLLDVLTPPAATLENFLPGPNAAALAAACALAPGRAVYFWGQAGCGRTHLLRALADRHSRYLCAGQCATGLLALAQGSSAALPRLIAVDDVHRMDAIEQAALFALYNRWRECATTDQAFALALAGDCAPLAARLREDLRTRLGWDVVCRLEPLSDADKRAALQSQAAARGLVLAADVLNWILTRCSRDMRALTGLLDALDRYSLTEQRPITTALLRTMLNDPDFGPDLPALAPTLNTYSS